MTSTVAGLSEQLALELRRAAGDPHRWAVPPGYPNGLALCVIDAITSIGVRYRAVERVVGNYRAERGAGGDCDGVRELLATFTALGGVEAWADRMENHNRAWSRRGAPLKAAVIHELAAGLQRLHVQTAADLRARHADEEVRGMWLSTPGQRSGISWRYAGLLAGVETVKPDRMVRRFLGRVSGETLSDAQIVEVVEQAAVVLGVSTRTCDHVIWQFGSGRTVRLTEEPKA